MQLKHILESQQFSQDWLENELFPLTREMEKVVSEGGTDSLYTRRMITFFYEPSTRTRCSFEMAMDMLGGRVVFSTENARQFSSIAKGESIEDTMRVLSGYRSDIIVLRTDEEGMAKKAAEFSSVPIINAGDGAGQHPTQALIDIYTIQKELRHVAGISIAMVGDLAKGRTVRSLSYLLGKFPGVKIYFVSPETNRMRDDIKDYLNRHQVFFTECDDLRTVAPVVDVIYQTRTQTERGSVIDRSDRTQGFFTVDSEILSLMKKNSIIMHPLPRNKEITSEVDADPRAAYFRQSANGLRVDMALLKLILG